MASEENQGSQSSGSGEMYVDVVGQISSLGVPDSRLMKRRLRKATKAAAGAPTKPPQREERLPRGFTSSPQSVPQSCREKYKFSAMNVTWRRIRGEAACREAIKRQAMDLAIRNNCVAQKKEKMRREDVHLNCLPLPIHTAFPEHHLRSSS